MRRPTIFVSLLAASCAWANPGATDDDLGVFLAENGFIGQIQHLTRSATLRATDAVSHAIGFLGVPYRLGGHSIESGFDCSGFVRAIVGQTFGMILPRKAEQQAAATAPIDRTQLQPGDLVFFNTLHRAFSHVGMYVGDGKFIHSPKSGALVRLEDMTKPYWLRRFDGARRVAGSQPTSSSNLP